MSRTLAAPVVIQSPCTSPRINRSKTDCCLELKRIIRCISEYKTLRGFVFFLKVIDISSVQTNEALCFWGYVFQKKKMTKLTGLSAAAALPGTVDLRNWISLLGSYQPLMWHSDRIRGGRQVWERTETPQMLQILKGLISQWDFFVLRSQRESKPTTPQSRKLTPLSV